MPKPVVLMLLPQQKFLFYGIDEGISTSQISEMTKFANDFLSDPTPGKAGFTSFGVKAIIDARITPAVCVWTEEN